LTQKNKNTISTNNNITTMLTNKREGTQACIQATSTSRLKLKFINEKPQQEKYSKNKLDFSSKVRELNLNLSQKLKINNNNKSTEFNTLLQYGGIKLNKKTPIGINNDFYIDENSKIINTSNNNKLNSNDLKLIEKEDQISELSNSMSKQCNVSNSSVNNIKSFSKSKSPSKNLSKSKSPNKCQKSYSIRTHFANTSVIDPINSNTNTNNKIDNIVKYDIHNHIQNNYKPISSNDQSINGDCSTRVKDCDLSEFNSSTILHQKSSKQITTKIKNSNNINNSNNSSYSIYSNLPTNNFDNKIKEKKTDNTILSFENAYNSLLKYKTK
jgi:hypothetical protein